MSISTTIQWIVRGTQLSTAIIVLAIYSFFLASHTPSPSERAIAAISGSATAYALIALLLLVWHSPPWPLPTTFLAVLLDAAFAAASIYVAAANRLRSSRCAGTTATVECRLQTACLVVSIVAAVFFALSVPVQLALVRRRGKQARHPLLAHHPQGQDAGQAEALKGGIVIEEHAVLPRHALPDQVDDRYLKYETAYGHHQGGRRDAYGLGSPHYRYDDGIYDLP